MKRDMELIRQILLEIEADDDVFAAIPRIKGKSLKLTRYQIDMLVSEGYLSEHMEENYGTPIELGFQITWKGHEFLETIRDPVIWSKTKDGAKKAGTWSVTLLMELGKAYAMQTARDHGLPV
ncbi:DUF2513 domain-containing protein [Novosphingobium clariflavum]|uniref:DUF2513 domain-containing protein n=1 Tax=Novosphingobium clariflavum TaxID=2029884 RepID=A0ABV6SEB5_9SPHN|nr:DUF2513 domain-containing protein [Novosphingobium clariflavum]